MTAATVEPKTRKGRHRSGPQIAREFRRFTTQGLEVREASGGGSLAVLSGLPIRYNAPYMVADMFGEFEETMMPGVAAGCLAQSDIRFLFNHDGMPLARNMSGTLTLTDTDDGLSMSATIDTRSNLANDLLIAIERGDVSQMSCGFIVALDEWNAAMTQRSIYRFAEMFDVSAVTYPASPTTSIELALRSMMAAPIESRSRLRKLWAVAREEAREGKVLSSENATLLQDALAVLHDADDVDIPGIVETLHTIDTASGGLRAADAPDVEERAEEPATAEADADAGATEDETRTGTPGIPQTRAERRDADRSFNDIEQAVSDALTAQYSDGTDGWFDLWLQDCGPTWAVFHSYEPNPGVGLWQISYVIDANGQVSLADDLMQVVEQTTYVPVDERSTDKPTAEKRSNSALALELEALRLRGRRHAA